MADDDHFLAELNLKIEELLKKGQKDPWALFLIRALQPFPDGAERQHILKRIKMLCAEVGHALPPTFEQTVQRTFNNHNSDRSGKPPKYALFHCGGKSGSGLWALHHDNAKGWMASHGYAETEERIQTASSLNTRNDDCSSTLPKPDAAAPA